ncbi:hypothetical protein ACWGI8_19460 [Streptomyces sp. NPDC054841]
MPRRHFLQTAAGTAVAAAAVPAPAEAPARAAPQSATRLRLTAATNGAATPTGPGPAAPLVAEVQNIVWRIPRDGSPATALVAGDPLTGIDDLAKVTQVTVGGRIHDRKTLEEPYVGPGRRRSSARSDAESPQWRAVAEQMRRDGCCG